MGLIEKKKSLEIWIEGEKRGLRIVSFSPVPQICVVANYGSKL